MYSPRVSSRHPLPLLRKRYAGLCCLTSQLCDERRKWLNGGGLSGLQGTKSDLFLLLTLLLYHLAFSFSLVYCSSGPFVIFVT